MKLNEQVIGKSAFFLLRSSHKGSAPPDMNQEVTDMNETLGNIIMRLRKEHDLTQEQLANGLGITYQAVSKWETGVSSPDISMLPLLADIFEVSIDELFGRPAPAAAAETAEPEAQPAAPAGLELPWPDDESTLHVVLFAGHRLLGADEKGERLYSRRQIEFQYEGPALNIQSDFTVNCGPVQGNVTAGDSVNCDAVYGDLQAGGEVNCDDVTGNLSAGGDVNCDDVAGNVSAGGNVDCGNVEGSVTASGNADCGKVGGSVNAGGNVDCGSVGGTVRAATVNGEAPDDGEFHSNLKGKKRGFSFELKL